MRKFAIKFLVYYYKAMPDTNWNTGELTLSEYKYGFVSDSYGTAPVDSTKVTPFISLKKIWDGMDARIRLKLIATGSRWKSRNGAFSYPEINYQDIIFYAAPRKKIIPASITGSWSSGNI